MCFPIGEGKHGRGSTDEGERERGGSRGRGSWGGEGCGSWGRSGDGAWLDTHGKKPKKSDII
jgi:hypothetical protein